MNTIATPCSSAAAITSSSRTLPPGWMTAVAPACTTTSRPSRKGKNASEATAEPARAEPGVLRLDGGNAGAVHPAHLSRPNAQRLTIGAEDNGIGLHEFCHAPGKQQVLKLLLGRFRFGHHFQLRAGDVKRIRRLHQQSAAHALEVETYCCPSGTARSEPARSFCEQVSAGPRW